MLHQFAIILNCTAYIICLTHRAESEACSAFRVGTDLSSTVRLNDGVLMPLYGLGLWQAEAGQIAEDTVVFALKNGYRLLDTAQIYG